MLAFVFFIVIRYYGIDEEMLSNKIAYKIPFYKAFTYAIFIGVFLGTLYAIIEFVYDKYILKRTSLWVQLITKTLIYLIVLIICVSIVRNYYQLEYNIEINIIERGWWTTNKSFWVTVMFFLFSSVVFSIIKMTIEKFGKEVFIKMLLGKYKTPKEEKRIFMFLDLKNSTSIAEKLGHFNYSKFIQDCFYDLNEVVSKYDAEIYQYVGDEAVLNWEYKKGLANNNCVSLFFDYQQKLLSKKEYYLEVYNEIPEFKAGLHGGKLMVAEVGIIKKELAYHGDVINTSARIQSECKALEVPVLISEKLLDDLKMENKYFTKLIGNILLKGKEDKVNLYTISEM